MNNIDTQVLLDNTNKNQRIAASPIKSIWASANAGAGKTKVLIDRIARLLLAGSDPSKILAVTYTKAAAAEMTTRLFNTLGDWATQKDDDLKKRLKELDPDLVLDDELLSQARRLFARALETPGGLKIETIHAFCGNILKRFPLEAGIAPNFEVIEESEAARLMDLALLNAAAKSPQDFKDIKAILPADNLAFSFLNAAQMAGNREVSEIANNLVQCLGIEEIATLDEMISRATDAIDMGLLKECGDVLAGGSKTEQDNSQKIYDALAADNNDKFDALLRVITTKSGELSKRYPATKALENHPAIIKLFGEKSEFPDGQMGQFWHLAQAAQKAKIYHDTLLLIKTAREFKSEYLRLKQRAAKLDFGDLLQKTSELLNRDEGSALWVLYKLDMGLQHVLIDESQDTSAEQWDLLNPLLSALEAGERNYARTRFVVGDDKQSIYSFQGASPERYLTELGKFKQITNIGDVEFKDVDFNMSFRTGQNILDAVDEVWGHLYTPPNQAPEVKFAPTRHYSARVGQAGQVEIWDIEMGKSDDSEREAWDHPLDEIRESSPINQLAENIALEIKRRTDGTHFINIDKDNIRPIEAKDFMILVKTRKALFHQIIKRLKHYNIPVAGSDLIIIKEDPAVMDLIALGRFALRPEDDFNLACVLKGVFCNLYDDDKHLFPLAYGRGGKSLWQVLRNNEDEVFANTKTFLRDISDKGASFTPFEFLTYVLERKSSDGRTGWESLIARLGRESKEAVEVLLDLALKADSMGRGHLLSFLDMVEFESGTQKRDFDEHSDGVKVMTVHGAKGREAPFVILPDTTRGLGGAHRNIFYDAVFQTPLLVVGKIVNLPMLDDLKEAANQKSLEEDARLLYVAMTRARDRLLLCGHKFKNDRDKNSWYAAFEETLIKNDNFKQKEIVIKGEVKNIRVLGDEPDRTLAIKEANAKTINKIEVPNWAINEPMVFDPPPKMVAPSALFDEDNEPPTVSPLLGGSKSRYLRGALIHNLLELLPNVAPGIREDWAHNWVKNRNIDSDLKVDIVHQALKIINDERFMDLFGENSRAEVAIVGKGKNLDDNIVVNGNIDRLVIKENEILVLDYKTNRPPPTDADNIPKVYINQMAAYRAVLQNQFPNHKIICALLWTDIPLLMEISGEIMDLAVTKIKQI